ncbi:MAG: trypsin-like peptidase domain-containing protein [Phycisphaeraceae bacterium]|nr:trypsin-like peptidase domain-containing protein [Phycisphaeraceae bacterium]
MRIALGLVLCVFVMMSVCVADEAGYQKNAKQVVEKYGPGLVWVSATTKVDIPDVGEQEKRGNSLGIMIHESGLTMLSLHYFDQSQLITAAVRRNNPDASPSVTVTDILITIADGTEMEGKLIFKDPDLDLAFILPNQEEAEEHKPFTLMTVAGDGKAQIMDRIVTLGRLEESYNRQLVAIPAYIASVITKPRTYYYTKDGVPGAPAFNASGDLLGLWVTRFKPAVGPSSIRPMILPISDIKPIADQAIKAIEQAEE